MKMGMKADIGSDYIVLDEDPSPPKKIEKPYHIATPIFYPCLLWPNSLIDYDVTLVWR